MGVVTIETIFDVPSDILVSVLENMFRDVDYSLSFIPHWVGFCMDTIDPVKSFCFSLGKECNLFEIA